MLAKASDQERNRMISEVAFQNVQMQKQKSVVVRVLEKKPSSWSNELLLLLLLKACL
jgi:hypothetical protein